MLHSNLKHVMADTLGSVGVIVSTILIHYFHWTGFDPIASLLIGLMILGSVVPLVIDSGRILCLELSNKDSKSIELAISSITSIPGVHSITAARFWPLDGEVLIGSIVCFLRASSNYSMFFLNQIPMEKPITF